MWVISSRTTTRMCASSAMNCVNSNCSFFNFLNLWLKVCICFPSPSLFNFSNFLFLFEASVINPQFNVTMTSQNFQHILSWEAGSNTTVPTYYQVKYSSFRFVSFPIVCRTFCYFIVRIFCLFSCPNKSYKICIHKIHSKEELGFRI